MNNVDRFAWLTLFRPCQFTLDYQPQATSYESVETWLADNEERDYCTIIDGEREKMIANKTIWVLHAYPITPVGFIAIAAASLEALLDYAATVEWGIDPKYVEENRK